jgi:hypothetical protein
MSAAMVMACAGKDDLGATYDDCVLKNVLSKTLEQQAQSNFEAGAICVERFTTEGKKPLGVRSVDISRFPDLTGSLKGKRLSFVEQNPAQQVPGLRPNELFVPQNSGVEAFEIERNTSDLPLRIRVRLRLSSEERHPSRKVGPVLVPGAPVESVEAVGTFDVSPGQRKPVVIWMQVPATYAGHRRDVTAETVRFLRN